MPENICDEMLMFAHLMEHNVIVAPGGISRIYMNQKDDENIKVASGFALEEDGTWRIRAWLLLKNHGYKIVDNIKEKKYFGMVMPY